MTEDAPDDVWEVGNTCWVRIDALPAGGMWDAILVQSPARRTTDSEPRLRSMTCLTLVLGFGIVDKMSCCEGQVVSSRNICMGVPQF